MPPSESHKAGTSGKLAILAGGGELPLHLAEACQLDGRPFLILGLEGMADPTIADLPHAWTALGSVGKTLGLMRDHGCEAIVLAGIVKRPDFSKLKLDFTGARLLPRVVNAARGGDDQLLSVLIRFFEEQGFTVVGSDDVMTALLAPEGTLGRNVPSDDDHLDIRHGIDVVRRLGDLDIGQGAVVCHELVLAVEAVEGTDAMLERLLTLPDHLRGSETNRRGVLVKLPKPAQERRIDLPTIGPRTVERAAAAGLAGIAIEAGGALILNREAVISAANEAGLFVIGFPAMGAATP